MVRLALRRDRVRLPVWIVAIVGLLMSSVLSVTALYGTAAARESYTSAVGGNPAGVVMGGPGYGLPSLGAVVVFEVSVVGYVAVALMSLLTVVRHTRAEEEAGRTELLRAGVVGRYSGTVAALSVAAGANALVAAAMAAGMIGGGLPVAGSVALAATFVAFGLVVAGVAAVAAQVTEHARGASGLGAAVLGVFFVVRAAGDVGDSPLSWASPMGWAHQVRPFAGEQWLVLLPSAVLFGALVVAALVLTDRRDVGAGLVPARPGRATASRWLSGPEGLALRQHRAVLLGWSAGLLLLGVAYGSVGDAVEQLVSENEAVAEFVAQSGVGLVDSFFAVAALMIALIATGFALQAVQRMRGEESAGRLEPLLATAVPRWRWAASHVVVAGLGAVLLLALAGLGLGATHAGLTGDPSQVWRLTAATLVYAPAVWALVGLGAALFGVLPRATAAVWGVLAACAFAAVLGRTLQLPEWVMELSPFQHVPQLPGATLDLVPLLALVVVSLVLVGLGLAGLRRRDVG